MADSITRKIYFHSPYVFKNFIGSLYGYYQKKQRYGPYYYRYLKELTESQWYSAEKLKALQINYLKKFLLHSSKHSIFLNKLFNEYNFKPDKLNALSDLTALPLLKKETIRANMDSFLVDNLESFNVRWAKTSGTTGKALKFPLSSECFQREHAFRALHYSWGGINIGEKIAVCAGHPVTYQNRKSPPFWLHDYSNNWLLLSSYHLTERNLKYYIEELARFNPVLLKGYPSSVYLLALANLHYGQKVHPRAVYTASETLYDFQRQTIEEAFGCKVYNWYGTGEMCANIVECEQGRLHMKPEHSYVEILGHDNKPAAPGEEGRVVCTGFGNYAFPLIRYDIGDIVVPSKEKICTCGRGGTIIDKIIGREEDYIVTPDGRFVGRLDHLFKDSHTVKLAQIIQNDLNEIILRIVKTESYTAKDEQTILKEARLRLGDSIKIQFDYVDHISKETSGKFKFIVSTIEKKKIFDTIVN